jgi:RNA polymerase sigma-70 factor (ECF subfamily)
MSQRSRGDEARFEDLYRRTRSDVLAYLLRRSTSAEEAADVLAETYLVAWQKLHTVSDDQHARLWLFRVARNLCLQSVRRRRVADAVVDRLAHELQACVEQTADERTDERLWGALENLTQLDQEIVTLAAWEGLTPREIATVVGISANAVRIRLHRARANLKKRVDSAETRSSRRAVVVADADR